MIIIFNKPYGVISQFSEHNIYDSLKDFIPIKNVYPAGRLDADSEGLVILTDNGQFQNRLSSPTSNIEKIYLAQVENIPKMEEIMRLEKGIQISSYVTKKSKVKVSDRAYIFGLLYCIGELKRVVLDLQNRHDSDTAKKMFEQMHDLFKKLEVFTEYSNSISKLKLKIDIARYAVNDTSKLIQK